MRDGRPSGASPVSSSASTAPGRPVVVLADTHVGFEGTRSAREDLARVVGEHAGAEVVLAGDVFDLSFAPAVGETGDLLDALLADTPTLVAALRAHLSAGHPVTLVPGNHDATLGDEGVAARLRARLDVQADAPLTVREWFVRRGQVHIEHGHAYDPDNAPIHPLAAWDAATEPLGIQLTRHFVARIGAGAFSHAQDSTPLKAIRRAFEHYGVRAPLMIAQYFDTAIRLCIASGPALGAQTAQQRAVGTRRLGDFAVGVGLDAAVVGRLEGARVSPTHLSREAMFSRLYFDRVLATLVLAGSALPVPRGPVASIMALGSLAYLAGSWARGHNRYAGMPESYLRDAAARVRELTQARHVVFGHTHREEDGEGYTNTGSFAFPRAPGRPYVVIGPDGLVTRRRALARS